MAKRDLRPFERALMNWLSLLFDFTVLTLATVTMGFVVYLTFNLVVSSLHAFDAEEILHQIVLTVIFLEIFELLVMYVREHHVSMRNVVELGVLAIVRKIVITPDYTAIGWKTLIALAALILVMGWVYVQERQRRTRHEEFLMSHGIEMER